MAKRILAFSLSVLLLVFSCGCSKMPFNGEIEFHDIALTIPERFVRDSTQSTDEFWIFEHGNYSEYILISQKETAENSTSALTEYAEYIKENGAECKSISFLNKDAVHATYYINDMFCQELLFVHNNFIYSITLRGGSESDFKEITDTVSLIDSTNVVES